MKYIESLEQQPNIEWIIGFQNGQFALCPVCFGPVHFYVFLGLLLSMPVFPVTQTPPDEIETTRCFFNVFLVMLFCCLCVWRNAVELQTGTRFGGFCPRVGLKTGPRFHCFPRF